MDSRLAAWQTEALVGCAPGSRHRSNLRFVSTMTSSAARTTQPLASVVEVDWFYRFLVVITWLAVAKAAVGLIACLFQLKQPYMWNRYAEYQHIPMIVHLLAICATGAGAVALRLRKEKRWTISAMILACVAAAYASGPSHVLGWEAIERVYVEALASFGLWLLISESPQPIRSPRLRQLVLAIAALSAVLGVFGLFGNARILELPATWGTGQLEIWELAMPLAIPGLLILAIRAILHQEDEGLAYVVAIGPMALTLTADQLFPAYYAWVETADNRSLVAGVVIGALLTLPVWLVYVAHRAEQEELIRALFRPPSESGSSIPDPQPASTLANDLDSAATDADS